MSCKKKTLAQIYFIYDGLYISPAPPPVGRTLESPHVLSLPRETPFIDRNTSFGLNPAFAAAPAPSVTYDCKYVFTRRANHIITI